MTGTTWSPSIPEGEGRCISWADAGAGVYIMPSSARCGLSQLRPNKGTSWPCLREKMPILSLICSRISCSSKGTASFYHLTPFPPLCLHREGLPGGHSPGFPHTTCFIPGHRSLGSFFRVSASGRLAEVFLVLFLFVFLN